MNPEPKAVKYSLFPILVAPILTTDFQLGRVKLIWASTTCVSGTIPSPKDASHNYSLQYLQATLNPTFLNKLVLPNCALILCSGVFQLVAKSG